MPLYYPGKALFLLWCMYPTTNGALWIWNNILRDFLKKHEHHIDQGLADMQSSSGKFAEEASGLAGEVANKTMHAVGSAYLESQLKKDKDT